jgi:peptidyl-tRNA hydrolase
MGILANHRDTPEQVLQRSAQQDPWVMYLVVRQDTPASAPELLLAAAQATMRCVELFEDSDAWRGAFIAWRERSFRKVTLRAKGAAWSKLDALDAGGAGPAGDVFVRALPPRLRSECGPLLRSLQVFNPPSSPLSPGDAPPPDAAAPSMGFAINPGAPMSPGKQMAQVAHAVLMCAWSPWATDPRYADAFSRWKAAGYPCRFLPPSSWALLHETADGVVVRDAGLTEVDPGTETVLAVPPGWGQEGCSEE